MDCDLVKFARFAPPPDEAQEALAGARDGRGHLPKLSRSKVPPAPAQPDPKDSPAPTAEAVDK
jgi:hypothetical protein